MARKIPPDRFQDLLNSAAQVFIVQGYRRTQMADIAQVMGVAKGTLYRYVESKAALFDVALRHTIQPLTQPINLPVPTPNPEATLAYVKTQLSSDPFPKLTQALRHPITADIEAEVTAILQEMYTTLSQNRTSIKLIDRCAHDYPALAALWFEAGRAQTMIALIQYLDCRRDRLKPMVDRAVVARIVLETLTFWAVHRHWDPAPQSVDEAVAETTVIQFLRQSLC